MKPAKGDIWMFTDEWGTEHHLILDDGTDRGYEIDYKTILLESGESNMLFFRNQPILKKVA